MTPDQPSSPYNAQRIGWELERTAMKDGYFGNALKVALDMPGMTDEDKAVLGRYLDQKTTPTDHLALQSIANRIAFSQDTEESTIYRLRQALHRISLCSQNSMSSKEECGKIARKALEQSASFAQAMRDKPIYLPFIVECYNGWREQWMFECVETCLEDAVTAAELLQTRCTENGITHYYYRVRDSRTGEVKWPA